MSEELRERAIKALRQSRDNNPEDDGRLILSLREGDALVATIERLEGENLALRKNLWLSHGCPSPSLYGDDGEMQCGRCVLDFKRDPINQLLAVSRTNFKGRSLELAVAQRDAAIREKSALEGEVERLRELKAAVIEEGHKPNSPLGRDCPVCQALAALEDGG